MTEEPDPAGPPPRIDAELDRLRLGIGAVDAELVRLLGERARIALAIGRLKVVHRIPIHDPERERQVLDQAVRANEGPLDEAAIRRLFERIIDESRRIERESVMRETEGEP